MSKQKSIDKRARNIGLGLAALVATVIGVGIVRSRKGGECNVIEESVYRGFRYRIELCPIGEGQGYFGSIPPQTVGAHTFTQERGEMLANVDDARTWIHKTLDELLGVTVKATFVGANAV